MYSLQVHPLPYYPPKGPYEWWSSASAFLSRCSGSRQQLMISVSRNAQLQCFEIGVRE